MHMLQISGLHPASVYVVSVSAKTAWFGPGQSIKVHTKPPALHVNCLPNITVPTNDTIMWIPQADGYVSGNAGLYEELIMYVLGTVCCVII